MIATKVALETGYRHIDTAEIYRNERFIGKAIAESGLPRSQIFITSKLSPANMSFEGAVKACNASLQALNTDYLDLYLIHWPARSGIDMSSELHKEYRKEAWRGLESLYKEGKCRRIGVSNYNVSHLTHLLSYATIKPYANQIELHPTLQQKETVAYCMEHDIAVIAYSSLGQGDLIAHSAVVKIATAKSIQPSQVLLLWALQRGFYIIPKSVTDERIAENKRVEELLVQPLTGEQMETLDALEKNKHYCWDSTGVP